MNLPTEEKIGKQIPAKLIKELILLQFKKLSCREFLSLLKKNEEVYFSVDLYCISNTGQSAIDTRLRFPHTVYATRTLTYWWGKNNLGFNAPVSFTSKELRDHIKRNSTIRDMLVSIVDVKQRAPDGIPQPATLSRQE